jgi:hypothetical protein
MKTRIENNQLLGRKKETKEASNKSRQVESEQRGEEGEEYRGKFRVFVCAPVTRK